MLLLYFFPKGKVGNDIVPKTTNYNPGLSNRKGFFYEPDNIKIVKKP